MGPAELGLALPFGQVVEDFGFGLYSGKKPDNLVFTSPDSVVVALLGQCGSLRTSGTDDFHAFCQGLQLGSVHCASITVLKTNNSL